MYQKRSGVMVQSLVFASIKGEDFINIVLFVMRQGSKCKFWSLNYVLVLNTTLPSSLQPLYKEQLYTLKRSTQIVKMR